MGKRFRVRELEQQHGDLNKVIPPLVNLHGQEEAGRLLGVSGATISNWLKQNDYTSRIVYEKSQGQAS